MDLSGSHLKIFVLLLGIGLLTPLAAAAGEYALEFDGNDYLLAGDNPSLNPTDAITIETWCYIPHQFYDQGNCPLVEKAFTSHSGPY